MNRDILVITPPTSGKVRITEVDVRCTQWMVIDSTHTYTKHNHYEGWERGGLEVWTKCLGRAFMFILELL